MQVCGAAGDTTTLRSVEPPYSYSSKESRRAARKRAAIFAQLIEEEGLEISNASPWPGGWQSRISDQNTQKVCARLQCELSVLQLHPSCGAEVQGVTTQRATLQ